MSQQEAKHHLWVLVTLSLIATAGIALPYPVLAPLFAGEVSPLTRFAGLDPKLLLGLVLAIYPLGVLVGSAVLGALSDQWGRRTLLLWTLAGALAGYGLTALAIGWESYPLFALGRLLTGFCEGNIAIARAATAELHPQIPRHRAFARLNAAGYGGWLLGPVIGGQAAFLGAEAVFLIAALAVALALVLVWLVLPRDQASGGKKPLLALLRQDNSLVLLKDGRIRAFFAMYLLLTLGVNAHYEFTPLYLYESFGFDEAAISYVTLAETVMMVTASLWLLNRLQGRFGITSVTAAGMLALGLLVAMLALAPPLWLVLFSYPLCGLAIACYNGGLPVFASEGFGEEGQGKVMGLMVTTFCLGNVLMALAGSVLALWGALWALVAGGLLCLLAWLSFLALGQAGPVAATKRA
ncbi:MFS transporter [Gallaecimonas sp. GXIMD4217]|uniref:MFS transporter n=1 Tax=Gallaecimonas sp. GXIMD4217 TaxID=3131927 RepID=UPI00311ACC70